jgi:hypothetical protein
MDLNYSITQLQSHAAAITALTRGVSIEQACWKPAPDSWSILEVINHLYDEEREDFRVRLDYILHRPGQAWPPIDPAGWVTSREYNQRDLEESVSNFLSEREKSLAWLPELVSANWATTSPTPWGQITAGDMFAAWIAHDILHLRQLVELHWAYTNQAVKPYTTSYAGDW